MFGYVRQGDSVVRATIESMKKLVWIMCIALVVGIPLGITACVYLKSDLSQYQWDKENVTDIDPADFADQIVVDEPDPQEVVSFPLTVRGEARGFWFFEATAPVYVVDASGIIVGTGFITAEGDWMTEDLVPFSGTVRLTRAQDARGALTLVFERHNASGLPEHEASVKIPIRH